MRKGSKHTKETCEKISRAHKGIISWNKGKPWSDEVKAKIGRKGQHRSPKTEFKKGMIPWNKGKKLKGKYQFLKGKKHGSWKGGKLKTPQGYILIWKEKHPYRSKKGYVSEHRLVIEKHLKRYLTPKERVHHIDGNKSNNVINNLFLLPDESAHRKLHLNLLKLRDK